MTDHFGASTERIRDFREEVLATGAADLRGECPATHVHLHRGQDPARRNPGLCQPGGVLLNQKVTPRVLEPHENREKLVQLLRTFFNELRGFHLQYNVVSRETLIRARKYPADCTPTEAPRRTGRRIIGPEKERDVKLFSTDTSER